MGRRPRGLALFKPSHLEQRSGPSPITEMVLKGTASKLTASPVEMPAAPIRGPESARQNNAFLREPDTPTGQVPQSHSLSDRQAKLSSRQHWRTKPVYSQNVHEIRSNNVRSNNDPSAGSPTETLLRLLLPLNDQVRASSRPTAPPGEGRAETNPMTSLNRSIGSSDGRCVQRAGT